MQVVYLFALLCLGLHLMILVHELGHFWIGRGFNLAMPRFVVGVGPKLFGFSHRDTYYEWRALPFAGFVNTLGFGGPEDANILEFSRQITSKCEAYISDKQPLERYVASRLLLEITSMSNLIETPNRHYYSLTGLRKVGFLVAGPAMNLIFALLLLSAAVAVEFRHPTMFRIDSDVASHRISDTFQEGDSVRMILRGDPSDQARWKFGAVGVPDIVTFMRIRSGREEVVPVDQSMLAELNGFSMPFRVTCLCKEMGSEYPPACLPGAGNLIHWLLSKKHNSWQLVTGWMLAFPVRVALILLATLNLVVGLGNLLPLPPLDGGRVTLVILQAVGVPISDGLALKLSIGGCVALSAIELYFWIRIVYKGALSIMNF